MRLRDGRAATQGLGGLLIFVVLGLGTTVSWAQAPDAQRAKQFQAFEGNVVPELVTQVKKLGLLGKVESRELADGVTFSYQTALVKLKKPIGEWSEEIGRETSLHLYLDCFYENVSPFPMKGVAYVNAMQDLRKVLFNGALDRLASYSALKDGFFTLRFGMFADKRPALLSDLVKVDQLYDVDILRGADRIRDRFK